MLGGGGVDGAIHTAGGKELLEMCRLVPPVGGIRCPTGEARVTGGGKLPVSLVIHTVGPIFRGEQVSAPLLKSAYRNSLLLAAQLGREFVCFPAISCGIFGYPFQLAADVAIATITEFCVDHDGRHSIKEIHFALVDELAWKAWLEAAAQVQELMVNSAQSGGAFRPGTTAKQTEGSDK
eukprot:TRINITY_DN17708_c0_g1_i1.p1 TRINITY_DN17708_c0_g1~~TRINITY_DN17708_c0_g1_i1.p1  ORF type:complete len:179 (+),score=58.02 TRINITY_DN17708_c0_g1_i1:476-1012(+)